MVLDPETLRIGRGRITQVFRYLEALNQQRNPAKRLIHEQPWVLWLRDLPDHSSVRLGVLSEVPTSTDTQEPLIGDDFILKVRRPTLTRAPTPPPQLREWLRAGWDSLDGSVEVHPSRNETNKEGRTVVVRFEDDPGRPNLLRSWQGLRDEWVQNEKPARDALKVFERLYELHGEIGREEERVELVLGDGILNWRRPEGGVHHPVLLQRLQLEFDPEAPEFTLSETDHSVELYSALFRSMPDVDGKAIGQCREELESGRYHPLGGEATSGFLRRLVVTLSARGEFLGEGEPRGEMHHPRLSRDAVVFMRTRTLGFSTALESILEDLQNRIDLPPSLLNVVGVEAPPSTEEGDGVRSWMAGANEDERVLLSKPANPEQLQIAQRLEKHGCVLVQGPPGTGKTHTIANLIGHLLAQGKSVLVTSHTTKALRMVREQVVEQLQALCVSVLERDAASRDQMKSSIEGIVEKSSATAGTLEHQAAVLERERSEILTRLRNTKKKLLDARGNEYRDIVVAGQAYSPSDAARKVAQTRGQHDWIPGRVSLSAPLPLSVGDLIDLYRTNVTVTPEDERELVASLPSPDKLLAPVDFERLIEDRRQLASEELRLREDLWADASEAESPEILSLLFQRLTQAMEPLRDARGWKLAAIAAGRQGGPHREAWESLLSLIAAVCDESARAEETLLRHGPSVAVGESLEDQARLLEQILKHLEAGGRLSSWTLFTHGAWKRLIDKFRVAGAAPRRIEHFRALRMLVALRISRRDLVARWERQIVPLGGPRTAELGSSPESVCAQYSQPFKDALDWHTRVWAPLEQELGRNGFRWTTFLGEMPPNHARHGDLLRLRDAILGPLAPVFAARVSCLRWDHVHRVLEGLARQLDLAGEQNAEAQVVGRLRDAVTRYDPPSYSEAFERLVDLHNRRSELNLRRELLRRLEVSAPGWAAAIRERHSPHNGRDLPGDATEAWLWRQLNDELEERGKTSLDALQDEIGRLGAELHRVTAELIDTRAWAAQVRRTDLPRRQALGGWLKTVQKIGKGTGKRVPRLQAEARKLMGECLTAVPVWIMPLSRVAESFDPRITRFDVLIIDEASQSDVMALLALYMGRQVVIVGDDEQVSPEAVGQNLAEVQHLIDEHLRGIPNWQLYDGQFSIYDLAMTCFGGNICLREHFRCVPEIIQFSNDLSYGGDIKPLRDASLVRVKPHVLAYRVDGASSADKVNEKEAITVASLLAAAVEQPEYGKNEKGEPVTFGVISLVGEEQARMIETLLRRYLSPVEYERRRIICGNAAQFQGDERDVMFLSVVDGPHDGPLALRDDPRFKKRFNVAASRARDQMWVVHSLNPQTHLKPPDLRRRLIEHAQDPQALIRTLEEKMRQVDQRSLAFEGGVLKRLVQKGYRVKTQWSVGYYKLDLVAEGGGRRLAVECDGDRHHPLERLAEDMARQAILERLGWTFVRIRGSLFFRDPDRAMEPVFGKLAELGIRPEGMPPEGTTDAQSVSELERRVIRRAEEIRREWEHRDAEERIWKGTGGTSRKSDDDIHTFPQHLKRFERVPVQTPPGAETLRPDAAIPEAGGQALKPPTHMRAQRAEESAGRRDQNVTSGPQEDPADSSTLAQRNPSQGVAPPTLGPFSDVKMNDPLTWRDLAAWAEREARLSPKHERFAIQVSMMLKQGASFSEKQRQYAEDIFAKAVRMGFGQSAQ
jgi:very-short-patch-repair endonuclease